MRRWIGVLLCLLCVQVWGGVPERPRLRIIGPDQGVPSSEIKALVRDADGYLWIGTTDGVARYDGIDMRVWRHDPDDPASLPGNNVQALLVDARNRLWIALEGEGVSILDSDRRHLHTLRKATHPQLGSDDIWALAHAPDGAVWLGAYDGGITRIAADGPSWHWLPIPWEASGPGRRKVWRACGETGSKPSRCPVRNRPG